MKIIQNISVTEDVTMVTLETNPTDFAFTASIFERIAAQSINVDMIAQAVPLRGKSALSFTVSDEDLGGLLKLISEFREENPGIKPVVSSSNVKISVYGEAMRIESSVAAKVFRAAAGVGADIRLITTSEADISLLITKADYQQIVAAIEQVFAF